MAEKKTGKEIAKTEGTALSPKVEEALKKQFAKALDKTGGFNMFPSISMQHGIKKPGFEIEGMDEVKTFRGTIIEYTVDKQYREDKDEKRPTCSSTGGKYGVPLGKCSECSFGTWKQIDGKNVKECKDARKAIVVLEDSDKVFEMKIPGTSVRNFDDYEKHVASKERSALGVALTEFSLDIGVVDGRKPWSILKLEFVEDIRTGNADYAAKVVGALEEYAGFYKETTAEDVAKGKARSANTSTEKATEGDEEVEDAEFVVGEGVEVSDDEITF